MARHDPHGKEDLGERFSQFASVCGITDGHDLRSANDTPALNALKALRGAPISMGRGEIPVRLAATSRLFCLRKETKCKAVELADKRLPVCSTAFWLELERNVHNGNGGGDT